MSKEAIQYINATLAAFGPDEAISMTKETWSKLREAMKALAEQPAQQEPVSGVVIREGLPTLLRDRDIKPTDTRLYTSPPAQRTWVGLTDGEIEKLTVELRDIPVTLAFAIEAKLKEKNT